MVYDERKGETNPENARIIFHVINNFPQTKSQWRFTQPDCRQIDNEQIQLSQMKQSTKKRIAVYDVDEDIEKQMRTLRDLEGLQQA